MRSGKRGVEEIIMRQAPNGCLYLISKNEAELRSLAEQISIPTRWIRSKEQQDGITYYLRLWGNYKWRVRKFLRMEEVL